MDGITRHGTTEQGDEEKRREIVVLWGRGPVVPYTWELEIEFRAVM